MKSKASIKGHPIHPILIGFPIAFFTGTVVFDWITFTIGNQPFSDITYYLELSGIVTAVAAAVPGIIDFIFTVPPKSSAKKRAAKHGLTNTAVVVLFSIAFYYRQTGDFESLILLALETSGFILMLIAGWMGGTLVYNNQIGVVNRYADSGKWNESYLTETTGQIVAATSDELKIDQMKLVHLADKRIVIAKTEQGFVAFDDRCTHKGGSLAGGTLICGTVQCPWHGTQFDVHTGLVKAGPASEKIKTYPVMEKDGKILLQLNP